MASNSKDTSDEIKEIADKVSPAYIGGDMAKEAILCAVLGGAKFRHPLLGPIHPALHILVIGESGSGKTLLLQGIKSFDPQSDYFFIGNICPLAPELLLCKERGRVYTRLVGVFPESTSSVLCFEELNFATSADIRAYKEVILSHQCSAHNQGFSEKAPVDCSTITAMRPQAMSFQETKSLRQNVPLDVSLLKLFDLIVILEINMGEDVIKEILSDHWGGEAEVDVLDAEIDRGFSTFVNKCRNRNPSFPPKVIALIDEYSPLLGFRVSRHSQIRLMQSSSSIYKLAGAYAKLHEGNEVTMEDARRAIHLHKRCVLQIRETFT